MKRLVPLVPAFWLLLTPGSAAQVPTMKLSDVMLVQTIDAQADADARAVAATRKSAPGWQQHLVRKDRGNRAGRYALVSMTDATTRRAATSAPPVADAVEYHRVGLDTPERDKLNPLTEVEVLGIHYIKVRPDRRDAFDRFVLERLHPTVGNLRPDLRLIYYKPVRGEDPGNYLTIFALTIASRDKYWPKGQDSDELKAAFKPMPPLAEELKTYLVDGSYATGDLAAAVFESREWADWVLVRPPV